MNALLTPIESCTEIAGLAAHEMVLGVSPNETHERLLAQYRRARPSQAMARARIVADIRAAVSCGATRQAADLLIVLRRLLSLGASCGPSLTPSACLRRRRKRNTRARPESRSGVERGAAVLPVREEEAIVLRLPITPKFPAEAVV